MKINILGTEYTVVFNNYDADSNFNRGNSTGYCNIFCKKIVICNMSTHPGFEEGGDKWADMQEKTAIRSNIITAFLYESGAMIDSSEHAIEWFSINSPKIFDVFLEAGAV